MRISRRLCDVQIFIDHEVDIDAGVINLTVRNFDGLHTDHFAINPEVINTGYLDELGKYILRRESNLFRLEISEEASR